MSQAIIVTTINPPTLAIETLAKLSPDWQLIVVGDRKTPSDWSYPNVKFFSLDEQLHEFGGEFAQACPVGHYARKNVGYLYAMQQGCSVIAETDDDNIPYETFLQGVQKTVRAKKVLKQGWVNAYVHFSDEEIWPRGLPLDEITKSYREGKELDAEADHECAIQQFLADSDPDVDAVFRLITERQTTFKKNRIVLERGSFCPFNSQNTVFFPEAYPLLYLPSYVSFRMTDIWRSFIAQECLYRCGGKLAFLEATVYQERNVHNLMRDFKDEIPGYLLNRQIMEILTSLDLPSTYDRLDESVRLCYEALVKAEIVPETELALLNKWLSDARLAQTAKV